MKKLLLITLLALCSLSSIAQTFANSLVIIAPEDPNKYSIYISGKLVCDSCLLSEDKWTLTSIYSEKIRIKIASEGLSCEQDLKLSPKNNYLQEPFRTTYKVVRKRNKLVFKLHSTVSVVK